ncbi:hypothetical protein CHU32_03730 [Superficieibacter electus]|uniref:Uncharacterized protein n=1 Tax=Superficieibacter electus TaxID=2022662 RepID=A0A2P5GVG8_9ENTR|nr:hypothetical protein [Superficieibacter electus]POP42355.1 hypothetical protein CHU33_20015 [Superficieibacter electus]POP50544.1 hypothetical protein CHU32_03730 [Superficieibacter electus]
MTNITIGTFCIHTSKWEKLGCRVVAHDDGVVVVKMLGGGYRGVSESSLEPTTQQAALKASRAALGN